MDQDLMNLKIAVGNMAYQLEQLSKTVSRQADIIEGLVELSNKGKGVAWLLMGFGGLAGALVVKLFSLLPFVMK